MKRFIAAVFLLCSALSSATAQVRQSGTVTPRHFACWSTTGVIQDCGTAAVPFASSLGTLGQGPTICANSAAITGPYNRLCFGANTSAAAEISLQNFGGATAQSLSFNINGTIVTLPTGSGTTYITGNEPFVTGHIPCFFNTSGTIIDCGLAAANGIITSGTWNGATIDLAHGGTGGTTAATARSSLGLGTISTQNANAIAVTGGSIVGLASPTVSSEAATKGYVDATSTGLHILAPVRLATAAVLPGTPTYANGASGVGATLTAGSNGALTIDGTLTVAADRVLVKTQASALQNGCYTVTTVGDGSNPYVLTRCTDFDTAAEMLAGSYFFTTAGDVNTGSAFVLSTTVATVGSSSVTFFTFSSASSSVTSLGGVSGSISLGSGLSMGGSTLSNSGVLSFNSRTGAVAPATGDYTYDQITNAGPLSALAQANILVNPGMALSQFNGTNLVTLTAAGGSYTFTYIVDQWQIENRGTSVTTAQQVTDAPAGFTNSLKVSVTTAQAVLGADDSTVLIQRLEGSRISNLGFGAAGAQSLSCGFWVKAFQTGQWGGTYKNAAGNRTWGFSYTVNSSLAWEYKTFTVTGDVTGTWLTWTNLSAYLSFGIAEGTNLLVTANQWNASNGSNVPGSVNGISSTSNTFQITGVACVPGTVVPTSATSSVFMRPFSQELTLAQRYYEKSYNTTTVPATATAVGREALSISSNVNGNNVVGIRFKTPKMATPTGATVYSDASGSAGFVSQINASDVAVTVQNLSENGFVANWTNNNSQFGGFFQWIADSRM